MSIRRRICALLGVALIAASCTAAPPIATPSHTPPAPLAPTVAPTPRPTAPSVSPAAPTPQLHPTATLVPAHTPAATPPIPTTRDLPGTLLFVRGQQDGDWRNDRGFALHGGQVQPLAIPEGAIVASAAPDGRYVIAVRYHDRTYQYVLLDRRTNTRTELPLVCALLGCSPMISPDGSLVAVNYRCDLEAGSILIAPLPAAQEQLAAALQRPACVSEYQQLESWLPGGEGVLVTTANELQVHDRAGKITVLADGRWRFVRATADGRAVLAELDDQQGGPRTAWRIDRATGQRQEIRVPGYVVSQAVESPDGRYLVFSQSAVIETGDCLYLLDLQQPAAPPACLVQGYRILAWGP